MSLVVVIFHAVLLRCLLRQGAEKPKQDEDGEEDQEKEEGEVSLLTPIKKQFAFIDCSFCFCLWYAYCCLFLWVF